MPNEYLKHDIIRSLLDGTSAGLRAQSRSLTAAAKDKALDYLDKTRVSDEDVQAVQAAQGFFPFPGTLGLGHDIQKAKLLEDLGGNFVDLTSMLVSGFTGSPRNQTALFGPKYELSLAPLGSGLGQYIAARMGANPAVHGAAAGLGSLATRLGERKALELIGDRLSAYSKSRKRGKRRTNSGDSDMPTKTAYDVRSGLADLLGVAGAGAAHYKGHNALGTAERFLDQNPMPIPGRVNESPLPPESPRDYAERLRTAVMNAKPEMGAAALGGSMLGSSLLEGRVMPSVAGLLGQAAATYGAKRMGRISPYNMNAGTERAIAAMLGEAAGRAGYRALTKHPREKEKTSMDQGMLSDIIGAMGHGVMEYGLGASDRARERLNADLRARHVPPEELEARDRAAHGAEALGTLAGLTSVAGSAVTEPEAHRFLRFLGGNAAGELTGRLAAAAGANPALTGLASATGHGLARYAIRRGYRASEAKKNKGDGTEKKSYDMRHMLADALGVAGAAGSGAVMGPSLAYYEGGTEAPSLQDAAAAGYKHLGLNKGLGGIGSMIVGREVAPAIMGQLGQMGADYAAHHLGLKRTPANMAGVLALGEAAGRGLYRGGKALMSRKPAEKTEKKAYDARTFLTDALASASLGAGGHFGPGGAGDRARREDIRNRKNLESALLGQYDYSNPERTRMMDDMHRELDAKYAPEQREADAISQYAPRAGHAGNVLAGLFDPENRHILAPLAGAAGAAAGRYGPGYLAALGLKALQMTGAPPPPESTHAALRAMVHGPADNPAISATLGSMGGRSLLRYLDHRLNKAKEQDAAE